eukprot:23507-Pyramimonas_sp.AAC.1
MITGYQQQRCSRFPEAQGSVCLDARSAEGVNSHLLPPTCATISADAHRLRRVLVPLVVPPLPAPPPPEQLNPSIPRSRPSAPVLGR